MDNNNPSGMITVSEAARRLNRSIEQVRRYLREGKLPGRRIGGQWFIEEGALTAPYEAQTAANNEIREVAATMYRSTADNRAEYRAKIEEVIASVAARREEIRKRIGDMRFDVVEMLREDRESH